MRLILVGLPLGNIEDVSLRAIRTLSEARMVICEDTRVFHKLYQKLKNLGHIENDFQGQLRVINEFNEKEKVEGLIKEIGEKGEAVLISDAGMPTVSDPGYRLVNKLIEIGGELALVPGPTAAMSSLVLSTFSSDRVFFTGFLPKKTGKKKSVIETIKKIKGEGVTVVIYEAPYRIGKTVEYLSNELGKETRACLVRELTKEHEEVIRGSLESIKEETEKRKLKGEMVLLLRL